MSAKQMEALTREQQVAKVVELMELGTSENAACKEVGIARSTFRTMAARVQAGDKYARALEGMARSQIEQMEVTIQDMRDGTITEQMAKIELDVRKWFASKFLPREYGDRQKVDHTSSDGSMTPKVSTIRIIGVDGDDG